VRGWSEDGSGKVRGSGKWDPASFNWLLNYAAAEDAEGGKERR